VKDPHFDAPCLYVFDRYPGGIGLAEGFLRDMERIVRGAQEVVERCECAAGCPSCIGAPDESLGAAAASAGGAESAGGADQIDAKAAVRGFLARWIGSLEG
jgi:ATP-dependent helicase YprA (DUF1998 family)